MMAITPLNGVGFLGENVFVITDAATGKSAVVDPCFERGLAALGDFDVQLILLTHGHFDHIAHAQELGEKMGAPILLFEDEAPLALEPQCNLSAMFGGELSLRADRLLQDGETLLLGETPIQVLHTPGHTAGSCCYFVGEHIFTGDTVMAGSVGRCDFPTGDSEALKKSLLRLKALPGNYTLHCGHGPDSDLDTERRENPYFY